MKKKNIIYMLADDLGIGDLSCYNPCSKLATPNFDRLAAGGLRFTDAHASSALCSPSRYSILTGRYNWRTWLKHFVLNMGDENLIELGRVTAASYLREKGYATACVGKWHLGLQWQRDEDNEFGIDFTKPFSNGPCDCGFDYFYGLEGSLNQPPYVFLENDRATALPDTVRGVPDYRPGIPGGNRSVVIYGPARSDFDSARCTEQLHEKAMETVERLAGGDKPFFLYYPTTAVHVPWLPSKRFEGRSGLGYYGDFVLMTDWMLGDLLDRLRALGIEEDTIVVFASDNGSGAMTDLPRLLAAGHNPSAAYRGYKGDVWEGGHRIPCIVRAPGLIEPGGVSDALVSLSDLLATLYELFGDTLPDGAGEDSVSNLALWTGRRTEVREELVAASFDGSLSLRQGPWKLEMCPGAGSPADGGRDLSAQPRFQLYRLDADGAERYNLVEDCPEVAARLRRRLAQCVRLGRSTPGAPGNNAGGDCWPEIAWMEEERVCGS